MRTITLILSTLVTITLAAYGQEPLPPRIAIQLNEIYPELTSLEAEEAFLVFLSDRSSISKESSLYEERPYLKELLQRRRAERSEYKQLRDKLKSVSSGLPPDENQVKRFRESLSRKPHASQTDCAEFRATMKTLDMIQHKHEETNLEIQLTLHRHHLTVDATDANGYFQWIEEGVNKKIDNLKSKFKNVLPASLEAHCCSEFLASLQEDRNKDWEELRALSIEKAVFGSVNT